MTTATRWNQLREALAIHLTAPEAASEEPGADPVVNRLAKTESVLQPREAAELWQLLTTYDREQGKDQLTGSSVTLNDAVVINGPSGVSVLVSTDTWGKQQDEAVELAGGRQLSVIIASELADALPTPA